MKATLNGTVNPSMNNISVSFEIGKTINYDHNINFGIINGGIQTIPASIQLDSSILESNTLYHYRIKATIISGNTVYGEDVTFKTPIIESTIIPTVSTTLAINTTKTTSIMGGNITVMGGPNLIEKGICWSTGSTPTINDNKTTGTTLPYLGNFTCNIFNFIPDTKYYYRAYAINSLGVGYGEIYQTRTYMNETISDYDGNVYNIIKIGDQKWLSTNLKTTHLNNGSIIPKSTGAITTPILAYSLYNNDINNKDIYGLLYTGTAALDSKIAPIGCHVPTKNETENLKTYMSNNTTPLKEVGITHWINGGHLGTNFNNFTALPSGIRWNNGLSYYMGVDCDLWTKTLSPTALYYFGCGYAIDAFYGGEFYNTECLAIRCIVD